MKVISKIETGIHVTEMKDGEIAVITSWTYDLKGVVVQRWGEHLVKLGGTRASSWPSLFLGPLTEKSHPKCKVQILPTGTRLEI